MRRWAKLLRDGRFRREERRAVIEGPHLVEALLNRGLAARALMVSESGLPKEEVQALVARAGMAPVVLADPAFKAFADAGTPQGLAAEIDIPAPRPGKAGCVFLEGVQDAGNVGAIIRSAAAFGIDRLVADRACADVWSPKVLRAAMGGHFALSVEVVEDLEGEARRFPGRLMATFAGEGAVLGEADLSGRLGWIFGSEGSGIGPALAALATKVRIPMPGKTESLNVAAAAAICLYEGRSRRPA